MKKLRDLQARIRSMYGAHTVEEPNVLNSSFAGTWKHQRWRKDSNSCFNLSNHNPSCPHVLKSKIVSTNIAIRDYAKNGQLEQAKKLFDEMPARTIVSWNTMISGYFKQREFDEALSLISAMHRSYISPNETTFSTALSACARSQALRSGKLMHCLVLKSGYQDFELVGSGLVYFYASCYEIEDARLVFDVLHERNQLIWSSMLVGYVQCNLMTDALDVFGKLPCRDVVAWTTIISGYSKSVDGCKKAMELFNLMRKGDEAVPNEFTLDCIVRACGRLGDLCTGKAVHGLVIKLGYEFEVSISGALIEFYCSCEVIDDAKRVYDGLVDPCLNDSNMLIGGLLMMGKIEEAQTIFNGMPKKSPVSYNLMIKGYAKCGRMADSKNLFLDMPEKILASLNTMISVYARNGEIDKALEIFEEIKGEQNSVTWNSMISGYILGDQLEDALKLYVTMHRLSISQTRSTFSALFHACACLGSLRQGQLIHAHLIKSPFESNVYVGTALVDMYSKCGMISDAQASFMSIHCPNVAAWTALINGYAHHGLGSDAIMLFRRMQEQGVDPNEATFVGVLSACTHAGMVDEGMQFFYMMKEHCGLTPTLEHFTCVVNLLGRAGHLREAEELIREMPMEADAVLLVALLNACSFWRDMEVGERVVEKVLKLEPKPVSACIIMSNIYAALGKWGKKMKVRNVLRGMEVKKDPGCSWIELNNNVHVFSVDDRTHSCCNAIYSVLEHLTANVNSSITLNYIPSQLT